MRAAVAALASLLLLVLLALPGAAAGEVLASGFADNQVVGGVNKATIARFAPDGEVFVATQNGIVEEFPNVASKTATQVVNLGEGGTEEVFDEADRGLLGMAVDPGYPARPYLYLLFSYNAPPGQLAPFWKPEANALKPSEPFACPTPPGPKVDGCTITGRLVRITIDQTTHAMAPGSETPLIENEWCQQFPSHSVGDLQFGPEGALYVSAGTGGDWNKADYGQLGGTLPNSQEPVTPVNPCGDPIESSTGAGSVGLNENAPSAELPTEAEGGQLRAQSFRRPPSQPATLDGTIARVDPNTGEPLSSNPNAASSDIDRRRIVAYGVRQPFRFTFRPGTSELWWGDVGENTWEEIDRDEKPLASPSLDFGWPCFEGNEPEPDPYGAAYTDSDLCKGLKAGEAVPPFYTYKHDESVVSGDGCPVEDTEPGKEVKAGSAITAIGFQYGGPYPPVYEHALFFGDYPRNCMWAMLPDTPSGLPDPKNRQLVFNAGPTEDPSLNPDAGSPVDLEVGPDKNLYYVNRNYGELRRLRSTEYPTAVLTANHPTGIGPLTVAFSASESIAATTIASYRWDFGDGSSTSSNVAPSHLYSQPGTYTATLTVTDKNGKTDTSTMRIAVDNPLKAVASASVKEGVGPLTVNFNGEESSAPDSLATYHWNFGDGASAETADASHTYTTPGHYTATLTVSDPSHVPGTAVTSEAAVQIVVIPVSGSEGSEEGSGGGSKEGTGENSGPGQESKSTPTIFLPPPSMTIKSESPPPPGPTLSGVSLDSARIATAPGSSLRGPVGHKGYTTGASLHFTISQALATTLTFYKRTGSKQSPHWVSVSGGSVVVCKQVSTGARTGKRHTRKLCKRPSSDRIVIAAKAGANSYTFSGWVGGVPLPAGEYRVTLAASGANAGPLAFTVVVPPVAHRH
jgi:PKD repeat protein/glucose/arabinose dehydrogenase